MANEISAFGRRELAKRERHELADLIKRSARRAHERFQFGKDLLDGVEVRAGGREKAQRRPGRRDRVVNRRLFVRGQVTALLPRAGGVEFHDPIEAV